MVSEPRRIQELPVKYRRTATLLWHLNLAVAYFDNLTGKLCIKLTPPGLRVAEGDMVPS